MQNLSRIDWRIIPVVLGLMVISLLVISSMTGTEFEGFWTPLVRSQIRWFLLGWGLFAVMALFDYRKLKSFSWILYTLMLVSLLGLYLMPTIQNVHRWYRIPGLGLTFQPSEHAKLILAITLAAFLERQEGRISSLSVAVQAGLIAGVPFLLILKQPDLGTALILFPIALAICYFAGLHRGAIRFLSVGAIAGLILVLSLFVGIFSHEEAFNSGPVDSGVDLFHSFNSPVLFHGSKERYIGEGEVGFHFFEAHSSSKKFYLKELCLKRNCLSRYLYNNINILALNNCFLTGELLGEYN